MNLLMFFLGKEVKKLVGILHKQEREYDEEHLFNSYIHLINWIKCLGKEKSSLSSW